MQPELIDLQSIRCVSVSEREILARDDDFAAPLRPNASLADFLASLPALGAARDLFALRDAIVTARRNDRTVLLSIGGRVLDRGLGPLIARLIEDRVITAVAMTGAALVQDVEVALAGALLAPKKDALLAGELCPTEETGALINEAIRFAASEEMGIGQGVGTALLEREDVRISLSVLATAARFRVPVSVHPAIGADSFNLHPKACGESLGAAGLRDLSLLAGVMREADEGVVVNVASSAVMPRVLLQALDAARNAGARIRALTTAIIDPHASRNATADILTRLSAPDGKGFWLAGPDEILLPLLFGAVVESLGDDW